MTGPQGATPHEGPQRPYRLLLPSVLLLAAWVTPLIVGQRTLYLRDVTQFHLPAKMAQAEGLSRLELWSIDPFRGGGQPLLGNPNSAPWYPDSLLLTVVDALSRLF